MKQMMRDYLETGDKSIFVVSSLFLMVIIVASVQLGIWSANDRRDALESSAKVQWQ